MEGIDDYTRFSNLVFDDDTVLQNDPKKLYTEYGQFYIWEQKLQRGKRLSHVKGHISTALNSLQTQSPEE